MLTMMYPISMQNLNMIFLYFYLETHLKNHIYLEADFFFKKCLLVFCLSLVFGGGAAIAAIDISVTGRIDNCLGVLYFSTAAHYRPKPRVNICVLPKFWWDTPSFFVRIKSSRSTKYFCWGFPQFLLRKVLFTHDHQCSCFFRDLEKTTCLCQKILKTNTQNTYFTPFGS